MEDLSKKRPDSPQVRRKSWPSAPRSILKRRPAAENSKNEDQESGLGLSQAETSAEPENHFDSIEVVSATASKSPLQPQAPVVVQDEANSANSAATVVSARTARKRRIAGIFQHYYPEGGWGYVILICAFLSHFLANGLQLGFLIIMPFASRRYHADPSQVGKT